jgi:hypothetical protein
MYNPCFSQPFNFLDIQHFLEHKHEISVLRKLRVIQCINLYENVCRLKMQLSTSHYSDTNEVLRFIFFLFTSIMNHGITFHFLLFFCALRRPFPGLFLFPPFGIPFFAFIFECFTPLKSDMSFALSLVFSFDRFF